MPTRPAQFLLLALSFFVTFSPDLTRAQETTGRSAALKFDEFGFVYMSDTKARLDAFAIELQNRPDAKGYLLVYRSQRDLPGLSARLVDWMRRYLVYTRGFTADRIVAVDAGPAVNLMQELWVVPPGATPPIRNDAYTIVVPDRDAVRKFDEYYYFLADDVGLEEPNEPGGGEDYPGGSHHAFAAALAEEPSAQAYVIAYPEYRVESERDDRNRMVRRIYRDRPDAARRMMAGIRTELTKELGVAEFRIRTINGGYRRQHSVELWIVPAGQHPPIATPNAFPPRSAKKTKRTNHLANPEITVSDRLPAPSVTLANGLRRESVGQSSAQKIDEFGDVKSSDMKARLDNFANEIQDHPNLLGYLRIYRRPADLPGWTANRISWIKRYLVGSRGISPERLFMIDAGTASNAVFELWLAGPHISLPDRADAIQFAIDLTVVRKFDDYYYPLLPGDWGESDVDGSSLPGFVTAVKAEPESIAYVIAYPQYSVSAWHDRKGRSVRRVHLDPVGTATKMLNAVRAELLKDGLAVKQIKPVNGGYRCQRSVELWIVPKGEHPPIATPNAFPPTRAKSHP